MVNCLKAWQIHGTDLRCLGNGTIRNSDDILVKILFNKFCHENSGVNSQFRRFDEDRISRSNRTRLILVRRKSDGRRKYIPKARGIARQDS